MNNCKLVLENGVVFEGKSFGCKKESVATIVYNTSVVGYQEIISDPTNCNQILCMTYPLIGNYGLTDEDYESKKISIKGMIVREYNEEPSNLMQTKEGICKEGKNFCNRWFVLGACRWIYYFCCNTQCKR